MSRGQERLENKVDLLAEAFGTFVQHQLTMVAHQPPFDEETRQLGMKRYQAFIDLVGRRLASDSTLRLVRPAGERGEPVDRVAHDATAIALLRGGSAPAAGIRA